MDSNGYNKSLFDTHPGTCWYCKKSNCDTARHEIFGGTANRKISKLVGLWIYICPRCHDWATNEVHRTKDQTVNDYLKEKGEELFRQTYKADFTKIFYGNPKRWELEALAKEVKERERKYR